MMKLLHSMVPEMSHHLDSTSPISFFSFRQDRDYSTCQISVWDRSDVYLRPMYTSNGKEAKSCQSWYTLMRPHGHSVRGGLQQGSIPSYGQNVGNKAVTPSLVTNFKSPLCREKETQLITQDISTGLRCSPTSNLKFWFWYSTLSFPFHDGWEHHTFPGTLKLFPSKVSLSTCWKHSILTKAPYQKQSE